MTIESVFTIVCRRKVSEIQGFKANTVIEHLFAVLVETDICEYGNLIHHIVIFDLFTFVNCQAVSDILARIFLVGLSGRRYATIVLLFKTLYKNCFTHFVTIEPCDFYYFYFLLLTN
jgi:hypothetical protein